MKTQAYCMKCQKKVGVEYSASDIKTLKNGARQMHSVCPVCGTKVYKFLPSE